jgi:hypothetical protein
MSPLFPDPELYRLAAARPESELLLLCAHRGGEAGEANERLRELSRGVIDWDYLYRLASRHALLPLLCRGLEAAAVEEAPREFRVRLRENYRANAARNTLLAGELLRAARAFEAAGVPLLAYKGPALALQAYGELRLRRFVDLDVIVRRRDVARAGELLLSLGFRKPERLTPAHEKFLLRRQHNLAFTREEGGLIVELHWEVAPAPYASVPIDEMVWERAAAVRLFGGEVRCLSHEDLLSALCVHGTKHLWERLGWVCDVAALVNSQPDLDWALVSRRARDSGVERMLHLGLRLARGLLGAILPGEVAGAIRDPVVQGLASEATSSMFGGADYEPAGFARGVSFNMRVRGRLGQKVSYLRHIFTPTDGDLRAVSLPAWMSFLYYLLRPLRLALKGGDGH